MQRTLLFLLLVFISKFAFSQDEQPLDTLKIKENIRKYEQLEAELKKRLAEKNAFTTTQKTNSPKTTNSLVVNWTERGPDNYPWGINYVMYDKNDPTSKKAWACTNGGLWYNNDVETADSLWHLVDASIGIASIAQDPTNPQIMYCTRIDKMHKSIDGGHTWVELSATNAGSSLFQRIEINSQSVIFIYAFQSNTIFKSVDGGASFLYFLW